MVDRTNEPRITQFRQQEMVQADPELSISTGWNIIDKTNWDIIEEGSGTVTPGGGGLYQLNVTAAEGDVAALRTVNRVDYVPSLAALWGFAFIADQIITEDQRFRAGVTTRPSWGESYRFQITGTPEGQENDYRLQVLKGGNLNLGRGINNWASDPRAIGWDETVGAITRNELGWYDFGEWKPEFQIPDLRDDDSNSIIDLIENPNPNVRKKTIPLDFLSPVSETATDNVNFRIRAELENIGPNASANTVKFGNVHYNILGQNEPSPRPKDVERNGGGIGGGNITTAQPYPLVAISTTDDDVPMLLKQLNVTPINASAEMTAYLMRKEDVTFVNGPDQDLGPPPGLDIREAFFLDADWNLIQSVTRFDAAGTGNNDPHVGTEGFPVGRKIAGSTVQGSQQNKEAGTPNTLNSNSQLTDLDYVVIFAQATETDGISLQTLDYEMSVDR